MAREAGRKFEEASLRVQEADRFDNWWVALTDASKSLGIHDLRLRWRDRDGTPREIAWTSPRKDTQSAVLSARLPVKDRRKEGRLSLEVRVAESASLEESMRTFLFLSRLLDESPFFPPLVSMAERSVKVFGSRIEVLAPPAPRMKTPRDTPSGEPPDPLGAFYS